MPQLWLSDSREKQSISNMKPVFAQHPCSGLGHVVSGLGNFQDLGPFWEYVRGPLILQMTVEPHCSPQILPRLHQVLCSCSAIRQGALITVLAIWGSIRFAVFLVSYRDYEDTTVELFQIVLYCTCPGEGLLQNLYFMFYFNATAISSLL